MSRLRKIRLPQIVWFCKGCGRKNEIELGEIDRAFFITGEVEFYLDCDHCGRTETIALDEPNR